MSQTTTVTRRDVAPIATLAFPEYRGPKHQVCVTAAHEVRATDLCWTEGSRSQYVALRLPQPGESTLGHRTAVAAGALWLLHELTTLSPWSGDSWGGALPDDVILVEHRESRGKDLGLRYYVSPTSRFLAGSRALAPAAPDLTREERVVLLAVVGLKSSYRQEEYRRAGVDARALEAAVLGLVAKGLVRRNTAGAVSATVAGRNARRAVEAAEREEVRRTQAERQAAYQARVRDSEDERCIQAHVALLGVGVYAPGVR